MKDIILNKPQVMETMYERAKRLAEKDGGTPQQIKNSTKHYFVHFFKIRNNIKSIGRVNGKLIINK